MINKRGQTESGTFPTIIVLLLALAILFIVGFILYNSSATFRSYVSQIAGGGANNVQSVIQGCETACATDQVYNYCQEMREVKYGKNSVVEGNKLTATCSELAKRPANAGGLTITCAKDICA